MPSSMPKYKAEALQNVTVLVLVSAILFTKVLLLVLTIFFTSIVNIPVQKASGWFQVWCVLKGVQNPPWNIVKELFFTIYCDV